MTQTGLQKAGNVTALANSTDRNAIAKLSMRDLKELADVMVASGAFPDVKQAAQAMVKILAGAELGFSPIVSMTGVHFFQGKVTIGANLIASLIKDSGKYEYKITEHTETTCSVTFYQRINGELKALGAPVSYSIAEATKAGLAGKDNWKKFPKDMLFAACIRQGGRRYCADVLRGVTPDTDDAADVNSSAMDATLVTPEGDTVNTVTGEVVEGEVVEAAEPIAEPNHQDTLLSIKSLLDFKFDSKEDREAYLNGRDLTTLPMDALVAIQAELASM